MRNTNKKEILLDFRLYLSVLWYLCVTVMLRIIIYYRVSIKKVVYNKDSSEIMCEINNS